MKNLKKLIALTTVSVTTFLVLTTVVSAQSGAVGAQQGFGTLAGLITTFNNTIVKALGTLFISGAVVAFMFFPDIAAIVVFVLRMVDASDNVPDTRTRDFVSNDDGLKFRLLFFGTKIVGLDGFFTDADPGAVRVFFVAS